MLVSQGSRELALRLGRPPLLIPLSLPICMQDHCNTSWYPYYRFESEIAQPDDPGLDDPSITESACRSCIICTFAQVSVCAMTLVSVLAQTGQIIFSRQNAPRHGTSSSLSQLACRLLPPQHFATKVNPVVESDPMTPHIVGHGWELRILQHEIRQNFCRIGI